MALDYKFVPLENFPRVMMPSWKRDNSPFGKTWTQIQTILERELRFLNYRVGSVVLMTAHTPFDVRNDGKLRADARKPEHPGVVLLFDVFNSTAKRYEKMSFECDKFTDWKANVRAIADALEALRKVDRYGVTGGGKSNAHYEGYKALPEAEHLDFHAALMFLAEHSSYGLIHIQTTHTIFKDAVRQAKLKLHPDKPTGSHELFIKLQKSIEILEKKFEN